MKKLKTLANLEDRMRRTEHHFYRITAKTLYSKFNDEEIADKSKLSNAL